MIPSFFDLHVLESTGSTNTDVKALAQAGQKEGYVLQARAQTNAYGRFGRTWQAPPGNLYLSLLLRPARELGFCCFYSFAAALALRQAVVALCPHAALYFKWPNDVLIGDAKVSGMLIEAAPVEDGPVSWLVLGLGVNVQNHPSDLSYPATSLTAQGIFLDADELRDQFLAHFYDWMLVLEQKGFEPLRQAWLLHAPARAMLVGTVEGLFEGLDDRGGLILRGADGTRQVVMAGDVFFR
ncbi:MAG: biotin--[acetyl-CoA-carboxylase] ligase [Alphaproteobacteria bacterium]|nr:biotin--[acetyl-CoA-carboxylase] ligase [Alphaproteobacteria bacterium]